MENLRNMPFETLMGVVEDYPWFGAAQKALCERMSLMGGRELARDVYASAALQVASRRKVLRGLRSGNALVPTPQPVQAEEVVNKNYRGAGDYFSREQYEQVKKEAKEGTNHSGGTSDMESFNLDRDISLDGFCTEALAEIYAEQGYFERAKDIYAKLILAEPEKNTYFATLIENLNKKN